jgi:CubicO group peptidase (beta-lactamase class C family)
MFVDRGLQFEPGNGWAYSNAGFILLGLIVEAVSGESYYDYVREKVFTPCGMANTDSYETDGVVPNLAIGYSTHILDDGVLRSNEQFIPVRGSSAGGGYSTVEDLFNFSKCLLDFQLLNPEMTDLLLEGKVESPDLGYDTDYAYGFMDKTTEGQRIVGHGGGAPGTCANLDIFLDSGYTVVVLSNEAGCQQVRTFIRIQILE